MSPQDVGMLASDLHLWIILDLRHSWGERASQIAARLGKDDGNELRPYLSNLRERDLPGYGVLVRYERYPNRRYANTEAGNRLIDDLVSKCPTLATHLSKVLPVEKF